MWQIFIIYTNTKFSNELCSLSLQLRIDSYNDLSLFFLIDQLISLIIFKFLIMSKLFYSIILKSLKVYAFVINNYMIISKKNYQLVYLINYFKFL